MPIEHYGRRRGVSPEHIKEKRGKSFQRTGASSRRAGHTLRFVGSTKLPGMNALREGGPGSVGNARGGPGRINLLPPRVQEELKLTEEQAKQIAVLETETKAKLEKLLTPDQLAQLNNMRSPGDQAGPGGEPGNSGVGRHPARPAGE